MNIPINATSNNFSTEESESRVEWEIENIKNDTNNSQTQIFDQENSKDFFENLYLEKDLLQEKYETFLGDEEDSNEIYQIISKFNKKDSNNSDEIYNIINRNKNKNLRCRKNNENKEQPSEAVKKISMKGRVLKFTCIENDNEIPTLKPKVIRRNLIYRVVPPRIPRPINNNNPLLDNVDENGFFRKSIVERI